MNNSASNPKRNTQTVQTLNILEGNPCPWMPQHDQIWVSLKER